MSSPSVTDIEYALLPFRTGRRLVLEKLVDRIAKGEGIAHPFLLLTRLFGRLKSADSILEKVKRKGFALADVAEIREKIPDVLGFRVVVENLAELRLVDHFLQEQFEVVIRTDQVAEPSEFGQQGLHYSLHYHAGGTVYPFELQLRTFLQHCWAAQSFHLFHKKPRELALRDRDTLLALSHALTCAEQPAGKLAESRPLAQGGDPAWRALPLCARVRLIAVEPDEQFAAHVALPVSGDDRADHEIIVARKLELYASGPGVAVLECSCFNVSSLLFNEPHIRVPAGRIDRAVF